MASSETVTIFSKNETSSTLVNSPSNITTTSITLCNNTDCRLQQLWNEIQYSLRGVEDLNSNHRDILFILSGFFVLLMQSGFPLVQYGFHKNSTPHILAVFIFHTMISIVVYWLVGYGLAFGEGNGILGEDLFAGRNLDTRFLSHWFFHMTLSSTVGSIVITSMGERGSFVSYVIVTVFLSGLIHPLVIHWCWSEEGWLHEYKGKYYQDYAGAGVIHICAGTCSTIAIAVAGPRAVRSDLIQQKPGHMIPISIFGSFLLITGFLAIGCGAQAGRKIIFSHLSVVNSVTCTILAAIFGGMASLCCHGLQKFCKNNRREAHPYIITSLSYFLAGSMAGMVSVSAGCDKYPMWASVVIGIIGSLFSFVIHFIVTIFKEDALHVIGVHLGSGIWGLVAVPVFKYPDGIIYGKISIPEMEIAWNLAAGCVIIAWCGVLSIIIFITLKCLKFYSIEYDLKGSDILRQRQTSLPIPSNTDNSYFQVYHSHTGENRNNIMQINYDIPLHPKNQVNHGYSSCQHSYGICNAAFLGETATQL